MTASLKMRQLESKISDLQHQYNDLLKERQQEITALISLVYLAHLEDKTLMGGFLFIKEKISTKDPLTEAWHDAGEKFLRQYKTKLHPRQERQERARQSRNCSQLSKQTEARSQSTGKKGPSFASIQPPQTTDQPPQGSPQQGEA